MVFKHGPLCAVAKGFFFGTLLVWAVFWLVSCGGSPAMPSPATPLPVPATIRDGWTGQVVQADVRASGGLLEIQAPGYLVRTQAPSQEVFLWPGTPAYVQQLVYSNNQRLLRWAVNTSGVAFSFQEGQGIEVHAAVNEIASRTGLVMGAVGDLAGAQGIAVSIDPADPALAGSTTAATYLTVSGSLIVGSRVVCRSRAACAVNQVMLHELGHAVGLSHVEDPAAVMFALGTAGRPAAFTLPEAQALRLMYAYRRPGNLPPDRDPGPGAAVSGVQVIVVRD